MHFYHSICHGPVSVQTTLHNIPGNLVFWCQRIWWNSSGSAKHTWDTLKSAMFNQCLIIS